MDKGGRERLVRRAFSLKKAWLLLSLMIGQRLDLTARTVPAYGTWTRKELAEHCSALEGDLEDVLPAIVLLPRDAMRQASIRWLAEQFDRWVEAGMGTFTISTVQQFEVNVGRLTAHKNLEIPPYTELLMQPGIDVAFRHPEYMLVRDLGLLHDLYLDAESICGRVDWSRPPKWAATAGENSQALARAVIQACFNLLESFVSGLGRAHVLTHPDLDTGVREKLLSTRDPLRKRIRQIPELITGHQGVLVDKYPLRPLFEDAKRRRDAFVHCEPGQLESERGFVKEAVFNDISSEAVTLAVRATHDSIRQVWKFVHKQDGPRWLPSLEPSGRFGQPNLKLVPDFGVPSN